ncbi:MAG: type II toxin-antitoxin system RelE family toxin [Nostoc sp.]
MDVWGEENFTNEELNSIQDSCVLTKEEMFFLSSEEIIKSLLSLWYKKDEKCSISEEDIQTKYNQIVSSSTTYKEEENFLTDEVFSAEEIERLFPTSNETIYNFSKISENIDDFGEVSFSDILCDVWGDEPQLWEISMTPCFIKDIKKIDKNLHDLVLKAINHISQSPIENLCNTVKPLTGEKKYKGFWRYRIKDKYRLLYQPFKEEMKVILHSFKSRTEAYN